MLPGWKATTSIWIGGMGGGLHDFSTFCDTCEAIVTTQRGCAIHPLDLTKSVSSTSLSTKVPSLVLV
jgi:hypothetical protein